VQTGDCQRLVLGGSTVSVDPRPLRSTRAATVALAQQTGMHVSCSRAEGARRKRDPRLHALRIAQRPKRRVRAEGRWETPEAEMPRGGKSQPHCSRRAMEFAAKSGRHAARVEWSSRRENASKSERQCAGRRSAGCTRSTHRPNRARPPRKCSPNRHHKNEASGPAVPTGDREAKSAPRAHSPVIEPLKSCCRARPESWRWRALKNCRRKS
jgi:hypothetical protein